MTTSPEAAPAAEVRETRDREFPALTLACITTGVALMDGAMSAMHEAVEHILGHPVWTHEFADKAVWAKLRDAIREHHPGLPFGKPDDWQATRDDVLARFPDPLTMPRGTSERGEDPITSAERIMGKR